MAQYMILIYEDEAGYATATPEVLNEVMQAHNEFAAQVEQRGVKLLGGQALQPTSTATTVRGGSDVTDGPFVETKEHLGGFAVVEVADDEAARHWAGKIAVAVGWPQEVHRFPRRIDLTGEA